MSPDERTLLTQFLSDLTQTRGVTKDMEADRMIGDALRASPDAPYVLVQHAIMSDQALHAAQAQIAALQDQLRQAQPAPAPSSFLPRPGPWTQPGAGAAATPAGYMGAGPFNTGGGLGSFLRNAGTTAAGVVGGSLLFEGISGLFGGGRGFGGGFGGGGYGQPVEEITNNYYSDDSGGGGGDPGGGFDGGGSGDY